MLTDLAPAGILFLAIEVQSDVAVAFGSAGRFLRGWLLDGHHPGASSDRNLDSSLSRGMDCLKVGDGASLSSVALIFVPPWG
jgi:hypothetical protein